MKSVESNQTSPNFDFESETLSNQSWLIWFFVFIFWTLIGAIAAVQEYIAIETYGEEVSLLKIIITNLPIYFWAIATPLIFWLGQKFLLSDKSKWAIVFPLHLFLSLLFAAAYLAIVALVTGSMRVDPPEWENVWNYFQYRFGRGFHVSVLTYWAVLGFGFALDFYKRLQIREIQSAKTELKLETQLVQAKLDTLKMQLHPHFLFNTLNTVSAIMSDDLKGARRMIARLSEILRINLETSHQQKISLKEELDLLNLYLDIERERFKEKLKIELDVPTDVWECKVPHFILQPLVENAIKHGIANNKTVGIMEISAIKNGDYLQIQIDDNGAGFAEDSQNGVGLSNTKERLEKLYGEDFELDLKESESGGVSVYLRIPFEVVEYV